MTDQSSPPAWLFTPLTPIELYVLIILAKHPNYAYDIATSITFDLDPSTRIMHHTIRKALVRMHARGWIAPYPHMDTSGRHEQPFILTDYGQAQLKAELTRLALILDTGRAYLARAASRLI